MKILLLLFLIAVPFVFGKLWGNTVLVYFYSLPLVFIVYKESIIVRFPRSDVVFDLLRKISLSVILLYLSFTMSIFSLAGSVYPTYSNLSVIERMLKTFNDTGHAAIVLAIPMFIITLILNKAIEKLQGFTFTKKGPYDPLTGDENISLRYKTFIRLVSGLPDDDSVKKVGHDIGLEYGKRIKEIYSGDRLKEYIYYWLETDQKSGLIEKIEPQGTDSRPIIKISNSFAKRIKKEYKDEHDVICTFFEAYSAGVLKAFDEKEYRLNTDDCSECSSHNECIFVLDSTA